MFRTLYSQVTRAGMQWIAAAAAWGSATVLSTLHPQEPDSAEHPHLGGLCGLVNRVGGGGVAHGWTRSLDELPEVAQIG